MNKLLEIKNLSKNYNTKMGEVKAIDNISFDVYDKEFLCIIGSSGCGKSTLLNILANLDYLSEGEIIKNNDLKIGYMLQEDCLLPWLNIFDNAMLGLDIMHIKTEENIKYVKNLLEKYGLGDFLEKYPNQLSGGMRQRVALIRTLATKPDILLLDEPFSALDYMSRLMVSEDVSKIIKNEKKTVVMITHDIAEALSLADRIIVLSKRPAIIKKIYNIDIEGSTPMERRKSPRFAPYYDLLWKELDKNV
jgi:NitT/TauT family transport system ATP-binding protein